MPKRDSSDASSPPRLITLGGLTLVSSSLHAPTTLLGPGKPVALLLYLHSAPNRGASREHLTDLLWADLDQTGARHALRQTVWYLRQRLGSDCIGAENGDVVLTLDLTCDRDDFVRAVTEGRADDAVAIYQGHFLPDFAVPGGLEFEHWADAERTRLRLMFLRAAQSLVRARLSHGHVRETRALALRVRDLVPLSEAAWRLVIETFVAGHETVLALAEAERLTAMLRLDGRTPEPLTQRLLRAIQQEPEQVAAPAAGLVAELVGREREFAAIVEAWENARSGRAILLHLVAPAGLGKTRLLLDVQARLAAAGGRCLYARANPGEHAVPFALAAELAAKLATLEGAKAISPASAGALVALNPALSSVYNQPADPAVGAEAARHRNLALAELLHTLADEGPLAFLIDDLHWADPTSRQMLESALDRLDGDPVLVVTTGRPVPGTEPPRHATRVELPPLTMEHLGALLASLGELPGALAQHLPQLLLDASGGSPLLALESLQAALEVGLLQLADGRWHCTDDTGLAERLARGSAVRDRVARLDRHQHWLLLLLATAGLPVPFETIAAAAGRSADLTANDLLDLERRGFAQRSMDGWEPAHDAIGEAALAATTDDARRAAGAALGTALTQDDSVPPHVLARAVQLLARSDETTLTGLFRRWVRGRRRLHDHRRPATLATEMLGLTDPQLVGRLARSLPLPDRLGLTPAGLGAAVTLPLVVGALAVGLLAREGPIPDAMLLVGGADPAGKPAAYAVPLFEDNWGPGTAIEAVEGSSRPLLADALTWYASAGTPDGLTWARSVTSDSGSVDIVLRRPDGRETWLMSGPADDDFEDWSPDGHFVAITTGRWHPRSLYDVATVEVASGRTTQVTAGDGLDIAARWSPDGSRLAFIRRSLVAGTDQVCQVGVDGTGLDCRGAGFRLLTTLEWASPTRLVVAFHDQGEEGLLLLDLATDALRPLDIRGAGFQLSPDGRWAVCRCLPPGTQRLGWYVFPLERPDRLRLVTWQGSPDASMRFYWIQHGGGGYLDRLTIDSLPGGVPVGSVVRSTVTGRDRNGQIVPTPWISWSVSDTMLATVNEDGSILARGIGSVTLTASAGGWRTANMSVRIHGDTARTLFTESWTGDLSARWRPFGEPRPRVVPGPGGAALLVNGDASHFSGLYSAPAIAAAPGVGLDVALSTPITASQWQFLYARLTAPTDDAGLEAWDHVTGMAAPLEVPQRTCGLAVGSFPSTEGSLYLTAGGTQKSVPLSWPPSEAHWYRARIQVFPDGRCGFALDGTPVWVSRAHLLMDRPFRVALAGQTVGSQLLAGPVEVWEGVRMDVDWEAIDR